MSLYVGDRLVHTRLSPTYIPDILLIQLILLMMSAGAQNM